MSLDDTLGCAITHISDTNPFEYQFSARIVRPNEVYEIHPTRDLMLGGEPIFIVVSRAEQGTLVEGFALQRFHRVFDGLETACS